MAVKPLPDQETLLKLLRYEPETGKLYWRERPVSMFRPGNTSSEHNCKVWNAAHAGREAYPCKNPRGSRGYVQANLLGSKYLKHRIIWKMMTGQDPIEVDHINGDKSDNRWMNLRAVGRRENSKNLCLHERNNSGCTGVFWNNQFSRWQASISANGRRMHLGLHTSKESAIIARKAAERDLGFHPNHGRKRKSSSSGAKE
jgi:hypothetical protein